MPGEDLAVQLQNDGSYEDAVLAMPDLLADDPVDVDPATGYARRNETTRDLDTGKFAAKEAKAEDKPAEAKAKEEPAEPEAVDQSDDDYIELPPEKEGEQPVRHKLDDVVEGWQRAKALETELAETKARVNSSTPLPNEIEEHLTELAKARTAVVNEAKAWARVNQPVAPNQELVNPASPNYNPELFHGQLQEYQRQLAQHRQVAARVKEYEDQNKAEQEALRASKLSREVAKVKEFWPEVLTDEKTRIEAKKSLLEFYGIDDALLDSEVTADNRFYKLAKDALAFRAMQGKQAEAVKAVKAKPKLIQAQARSQPTNSKTAKFNESYKALAESGSLEDAANALEGFL